MGSLEGKVAVVTGAGGGIGRAASVELGRAGASLVLVDIDEPGLEETARATAETGAEARTCVADVSRSDDVRGYVQAALDAFGRIDVFFNNAGIEGAVADLHEYPEEEFDRVIAVNLRGVFLGLRHVLPVMVAQGSGSVINTASMAGLLGLPHTAAYNAAKHGVIGLTKTAAAEAGRLGVRINAICPGVIDTRMLRSLAGSFNPDDPLGELERLGGLAPLGRLGTPEEIAAVVRFLASEESSYVNGASWVVDGGIVATR